MSVGPSQRSGLVDSSFGLVDMREYGKGSPGARSG